MGITGTIPTQFGLLTEVTGMDLPHAVTGPFPTEFGLMVKLSEFGSYDMISLTGTLPTEFGNLPKLDWVVAPLGPSYYNFQGGKTTGTIPTELARMSALTSFIS